MSITGSEYIWHFRFSTYDEALKFAEVHNSSVSPQSGGFRSSEWISRQRVIFERSGEGLLPRQSSLPELILNKKPRTVFDFGGGSGWIWNYILTKSITSQTTYTNIEIKSTLEAFADLTDKLQGYRCESMETIATAFSKPSVLYSNSVIQYLADNSSFLELVKKIDPEFVLLDDVMPSDDSEFFALQNYYGFYQVNRFPRLSDLILEMESFGFNLIELKNYKNEYNGSMIPAIWNPHGTPDQISDSKTLLFIKTPPPNLL